MKIIMLGCGPYISKNVGNHYKKNTGYSSVLFSGIKKKKAAIGILQLHFKDSIAAFLNIRPIAAPVQHTVVYEKAYRHKDGSLVTEQATLNIVCIIYVYPSCLIFTNDQVIVDCKYMDLFALYVEANMLFGIIVKKGEDARTAQCS